MPPGREGKKGSQMYHSMLRRHHVRSGVKSVYGWTLDSESHLIVQHNSNLGAYRRRIM